MATKVASECLAAHEIRRKDREDIVPEGNKMVSSTHMEETGTTQCTETMK